MPVSQLAKARLFLLGDRATPDGLALFLFTQGIRAVPNSDTDGIIQRYLASIGVTTVRQVIRGLRLISQDDDDATFILRSIAILVYRFNNRAYPRLEEPTAENTPLPPP